MVNHVNGPEASLAEQIVGGEVVGGGGDGRKVEQREIQLPRPGHLLVPALTLRAEEFSEQYCQEGWNYDYAYISGERGKGGGKGRERERRGWGAQRKIVKKRRRERN